MTDPPAAGPPMKLSTSQVSLILQRAAEIDARGDTLNVEELERIAAEAGIDPRATRTAIAEFIDEEMPAPKPQVPAVAEARPGTSATPSAGRIVAGGAVGLACGFIISLEVTGAALGVGVSVIYFLLRAAQSMKRGSQLDFQFQNFALWFGTVIGALATDFFFPGEIIGPVLLVWLATSLVGGLLVRFGPREDAPEEEVPQIEAGGR
ncbi:hypothetical protein [Candidatus Palauibacter sp.]|uniref:hypothetical protein n=1 Tax=Candidatus Palauibacter sp. TaxID=3101350 RepID=UPI003C700CDC